MSKKIVFFDMDGTLTDPRKAAEKHIFDALLDLIEYAEIGIVSGSGYNYISEQLLIPLSKLNDKYSKLSSMYILPCNGTQLYVDGNLSASTSMREHMGSEDFFKMMRILSKYQERFVEHAGSDFPFTGNFISNRDSMVNWCPIGRSASHEDRKYFSEFDKSRKLRENIAKKLKEDFKKEEIKLTVALGGSTSFDIYPPGWDKRYALKHFEKDSLFYFVGDKCNPGGNDYHIYEELKKENRAWETDSPEKTSSIIYEEIIPQLKESENEHNNSGD